MIEDALWHRDTNTIHSYRPIFIFTLKNYQAAKEEWAHLAEARENHFGKRRWKCSRE
jgi:hypothetical protein